MTTDLTFIKMGGLEIRIDILVSGLITNKTFNVFLLQNRLKRVWESSDRIRDQGSGPVYLPERS